MLRSGDIFSPKVGLHTEDVLLLTVVQALKRLVGIDLVPREEATDAERLLVLIL